MSEGFLQVHGINSAFPLRSWRVCKSENWPEALLGLSPVHLHCPVAMCRPARRDRVSAGKAVGAGSELLRAQSPLRSEGTCRGTALISLGNIFFSSRHYLESWVCSTIARGCWRPPSPPHCSPRSWEGGWAVLVISATGWQAEAGDVETLGLSHSGGRFEETPFTLVPCPSTCPTLESLYKRTPSSCFRSFPFLKLVLRIVPLLLWLTGPFQMQPCSLLQTVSGHSPRPHHTAHPQVMLWLYRTPLYLVPSHLPVIAQRVLAPSHSPTYLANANYLNILLDITFSQKLSLICRVWVKFLHSVLSSHPFHPLLGLSGSPPGLEARWR